MSEQSPDPKKLEVSEQSPDPENVRVGEPDAWGVAEQSWERLDVRTVIVTPLSVLRQNLGAVLLGGLGYGVATDTPLMVIPFLLVGAAAVGVLPWFSTRYQVSDTHLEVVRGVLGRRTQKVALERIRGVDIETPFFHRLLGIAKVNVGTGVDTTRIELNAVSGPTAAALKAGLLARGATGAASAPTAPSGDPSLAPPGTPHGAELADAALDVPANQPPPERLITSGKAKWALYAPLALGRLVIVGAAVGALAQLPFDRLLEPLISFLLEWFGPGSSWNNSDRIATVSAVAASALVGWILLSLAAHVLQWGNLRIVRQGETITHTSGLISHRSIALDDTKIRGVELIDSLPVRLARGSWLSVPATGVGMGKRVELLPTCPRREATEIAAEVLATEPEVVATQLQRHGGVARRRQYVETLVDLPFYALAGIGISMWRDNWMWLVAIVAITLVWTPIGSELGYRNLGHAVTARYLHARQGRWLRTLTLLERDAVIGWVIDQTWFQRRVGLVSLTATYAAGSETLLIKDVPSHQAQEILIEVSPRLTAGLLPHEPSTS